MQNKHKSHEVGRDLAGPKWPALHAFSTDPHPQQPGWPLGTLAGSAAFIIHVPHACQDGFPQKTRKAARSTQKTHEQKVDMQQPPCSNGAAPGTSSTQTTQPARQRAHDKALCDAIAVAKSLLSVKRQSRWPSDCGASSKPSTPNNLTRRRSVRRASRDYLGARRALRSKCARSF